MFIDIDLILSYLGLLDQIDSLAGVIETDAPGLVPLRRLKPGMKKASITLGDLPREIRTLFHTKFKTRLIQDIGTLPSWHGLDNWEDLADIWDNVFPAHALAENPDLQIVVQKLAEDKLNSWRHKFAAAAVEALSSCFNLWKLETAEERAETVKWLLEGTENSRVFYYRSYHDKLEDGAAEDAVPTGIFQSYLIANTLATHYKAIYGPHARAQHDPADTKYPGSRNCEPEPQVWRSGKTCFLRTQLNMFKHLFLVCCINFNAFYPKRGLGFYQIFNTFRDDFIGAFACTRLRHGE
ncbi:hypothetical protein B0H10DRAFT_1902379 [Mycena sp. CBHHK59/15]|nr:hypothetical protein B0H10DRAFT_1902379 [Mycena sp. CBHHK59/15]